jgi:hypothetical protein
MTIAILIILAGVVVVETAVIAGQHLRLRRYEIEMAGQDEQFTHLQRQHSAALAKRKEQ